MSKPRFKKDCLIDGHPILDTELNNYLSKDDTIMALNSYDGLVDAQIVEIERLEELIRELRQDLL